MNILIAPDKFKGSLSATEVGNAIKAGILEQHPDLNTRVQPMADGGDGSIDLLQELWQLQSHTVTVSDPLFRPILAHYYTSNDIAFIEMSKASGIALLKKTELNPLKTSSYGTGELILHAYKKGFKKIKLFIGGSATNDAGIGIATALGYSFYDINGNIVRPIGENLPYIHLIASRELAKEMKNIELQVVCDVNNPFFGERGAAYVYARQKGADKAMIEYLDKGLQNIREIFWENGLPDVQKIEGAGAAGGVGGGMMALFNAQQIAGIDLFISLFDVENQVKNADIVITGEGRLDDQSFDGKVVGGIYHLCQKYQKTMIVVCGQHHNPNNQPFNFPIHTILADAKSVEDAIRNAKFYLHQIGRTLSIK